MFAKCVLVLGVTCGVWGMSMKAQSTKSMSMTSPDGEKKMFVEHLSKSDLDSSASGYIYRSDGKSPATMVHLGDEGYAEPGEFGQLLSHGYGGIEPSAFEHGGGAASDGGHFSNEGEKGEKGYKSYEDFHKGLLNKFLKDQGSGYYQKAAGEKKGHQEAAGQYAGYDAGKKGESGASFKEESNHKKGHKTTGFHNVYHKDEFKKSHSFYDEADDSGHHDKYDKGAAHFAAEQGGYKKGDHADSGYQVSDSGKKGGFNTGSFAGVQKGSQVAEGGDSHYANNADYGDKGGFQKGYGYGGAHSYGR